ncbi:MAG: hypothetical protein M3R55_06815 [Acidobacteriota bacterium]|nr:hypothetical protein [Acidobacteriota bacterium]
MGRGSFRRALLAWLAAAGMLLASAGPAILGHAAVDADCARPSDGPHDHAAHRVRQAPDAEVDHCVACHLTRSLRGAAPDGVAIASSARSSAPLSSGPASLSRVDLLASLTRGPPVPRRI